MTLPVLLTHVAARWAATRTPAHGWVPDESETEMTQHDILITTNQNRQDARCACGWEDLGHPYDGTVYDAAAAHRKEVTS